MDVFGTDYPTPDGTCVRDYIHVSDLAARASRRAALSARAAAHSITVNCGYGRGYSVLEVIDTVKQVSGVDFRVDVSPRASGRSGADRRELATARAPCSAGSRNTTIFRRSSAMRSRGSAS